VDDRELAERCLSGDQSAIRDFVERFQGMVFAVCLKQLKHREDAEDVAQQTLVRAVRHLRHWDPGRSLNPWILTIAINRCRTHSSLKNHRTQSFDPAIDTPARDSRLCIVDLAEELQLALNKIRDDYRTCFVLFHQQELSVSEVAEIMKCPVGTVKTWLHRARRELAELLIERGVVTKDGYELHRI
jgi:RNA polymerase sigma-70 factor (ECF subfamily)